MIPLLDLQFFLPVFMLFVLGVLFIWNALRHRKLAPLLKQSLQQNPQIHQVQVMIRFLHLLLLVATLLVALYAFLPTCYQALSIPFPALDDPVINLTGIHILRLALLWLIVFQMIADWQLTGRVLFRRFSRLTNHAPKPDLLIRLERWYLFVCRMQSAGIAITLLGLFVTISSLVAIILVIFGLVAFHLQVKRSYSY